MAGAATARELSARGHAVRVLSRRAKPGLDHRAVDLTDGRGLQEALAGVDVAIDVVNARREAAAVMVDGIARLLAAEAAAGVAHHVTVSIVGIDRVPMRYYRVKLAQEAAVRRGSVPFTIVRATQFHTLVAWLFRSTARWGVLPAPAAPLQPVDPREVARVLADTAEAEPSGAITQFAGPEVVPVRELARRWKEATGSRALAVPVPLPGRAVRAGALTNPGAWRGRVTFSEWLRERPAAEPAAATAR